MLNPSAPTASLEAITDVVTTSPADGDVLTYSLRMATDGGEPVSHLRAELRRVRA